MSLVVLVIGHLLAVPFTVFMPGFLRLWRRREPLVLATMLFGAVLVVVGWSLRGNTLAVAWNATWPVVLLIAYAAEGRKRARGPAAQATSGDG